MYNRGQVSPSSTQFPHMEKSSLSFVQFPEDVSIEAGMFLRLHFPGGDLSAFNPMQAADLSWRSLDCPLTTATNPSAPYRTLHSPFISSILLLYLHLPAFKFRLKYPFLWKFPFILCQEELIARNEQGGHLLSRALLMIFQTEEGGGTRIEMEALKEGWCQCSGIYWSGQRWVQASVEHKRSQRILFLSNCCGQVLRGFLTVRRVLLLRIMPAVPDRLRLSQEQLCPFVTLPCSALTQGRGFVSSQGANPRNKGFQFEGWFCFHPQACWKWLILPLISSSSYFNILPPYWCRFGRWSL